MARKLQLSGMSMAYVHGQYYFIRAWGAREWVCMDWGSDVDIWEHMESYWCSVVLCFRCGCVGAPVWAEDGSNSRRCYETMVVGERTSGAVAHWGVLDIR